MKNSSHKRNPKIENIIAFPISHEDRLRVEARITISGLMKKEYYTRAVLGQSVSINVGRYHSDRLAVTMERLFESASNGCTEDMKRLCALIRELKDVIERKNAPG